MTITAIEILPKPDLTATAAPLEQSQPADPDDIVLVEDVDALTAANQRGCGNDNPYN